MRVETMLKSALFSRQSGRPTSYRCLCFYGLLRIPLSGWSNGSDFLDVYARQFGLQCISSTLHTIVF